MPHYAPGDPMAALKKPKNSTKEAPFALLDAVSHRGRLWHHAEVEVVQNGTTAIVDGWINSLALFNSVKEG